MTAATDAGRNEDRLHRLGELIYTASDFERCTNEWLGTCKLLIEWTPRNLSTGDFRLYLEHRGNVGVHEEKRNHAAEKALQYGRELIPAARNWHIPAEPLETLLKIIADGDIDDYEALAIHPTWRETMAHVGAAGNEAIAVAQRIREQAEKAIGAISYGAPDQPADPVDTTHWLTVTQAADKAGVERDDISGACRGPLKSRGHGRHRLIDPESLRQWMKIRELKAQVDSGASQAEGQPPVTTRKSRSAASFGDCRSCGEEVLLTNGKGKCWKCSSESGFTVKSR